MSEQNRLRSQRWFEEMWNQDRLEMIDEVLAADCCGHMEEGEIVGRDAFKQMRTELRRQFPNLAFKVEAIAAEGDLVAVRWKATGMHAGDGNDPAATHIPVEFRGTTWHRYEGGKLVEGWDCWNHGALEQQLKQTAHA